LKFDKNIITYMKTKSKFKNIQDNMLIIKEFQKIIVKRLLELKDIENLVSLLNKVNKVIYHNSQDIPFRYITYHAYHNKNPYKSFEIAKKSGGKRKIDAPIKSLKNIQTTIAFILSCIYKSPMGVHGFTNNKSIVTNAMHHVNKNYVYNIDLENFFPSIHKARIEKRLKTPPYNLNDEVATIISRLCTKKVIEDDKKFAVLPQGAPTSPILSNMICEQLDRRLLGLAKRFDLKYTRYADDITFSSMHNIYQENSKFLVELERIIDDQKFKINLKKTRLQKRGYRQEVTGLIVNDKVNVDRRYIKKLRAMIYSIEKFGITNAEETFRTYYTKDKVPSMQNVLYGKLEYLKMVKGYDSLTYIKLKERFDKVFPSIQKNKSNVKCKEHDPKGLVKILSSFTDSNNTLKYTTHNWDMEQLEDKWNDIDNFIKKNNTAWKLISNNLKKIKPQLSAKINNFLFRDNLGEKDDEDRLITWGEHNIEFGWNSKELKVWCDNGNDPFKFFLPDKYRREINGKSIDRFRDIVNLFKNEIEVRTEEERLKEIFREIKKDILGKDFKLSLDRSLEGIDFYTDVQHFKNGLRNIFQEIATRTQYPQINIKAEKNIDERYVEIYITHIDSFSNKESKELLKEVENGNFADIKKSFCSLCDWSVQDRCSDGTFEVHYLGESSNKPPIDNIEGFTHKLRFYR